MDKNKILGVDIDETCLGVLPFHLQWCNMFAGTNYTFEDIGYSYDLQPFFDFDGVMDFWSTPHLYQKLKPKKDCVDVLTKLHMEGWTIGFVTYAKKAHLSSKCKWIKQHFPFYSFILPTKEKGFARCTHFIDDRHKYLNQMPGDVKLIKMDTPYKQDEQIRREYSLATDWKDVYNILTETE